MLLPSECMRVLLLRRVRVHRRTPLAIADVAVLLDALGDQRTACPTAGVLSPRCVPLERAAARVCREAGSRVANNVMLRDMNIEVPLADARRLEVQASGLPLYQ